MIVDKDIKGRISIMEIRQGEAEILVDAICQLFADKPLQNRSKDEKEIIRLKLELEKQY